MGNMVSEMVILVRMLQAFCWEGPRRVKLLSSHAPCALGKAIASSSRLAGHFAKTGLLADPHMCVFRRL
jgi:hypothetical protein